MVVMARLKVNLTSNRLKFIRKQLIKFKTERGADVIYVTNLQLYICQ